MVFSDILMKRRKELGMTQDDLAEKLKVSRQSISKWENGECLPDSDKLIRLSDILEISLDELTGREVKMEPIVLEAPKIPAKPTPKSKLSKLLIAAALCLALGLGGFFLGRALRPEKTAQPAEEPAAAEQTALPEQLTVSGLTLTYDSSVLRCSFVSNSPAAGTVYFYREDGTPMQVETRYQNGMQTAEVQLIDGMDHSFEKAVFVVRTDAGERTVLLAEQIVLTADGGASYSPAQ